MQKCKKNSKLQKIISKNTFLILNTLKILLKYGITLLTINLYENYKYKVGINMTEKGQG